MTHFADLEPCTYFGPVRGPMLAVGWLDPAHAYARGPVPREAFEALAALAVEPWQPMVAAGRQHCLFCAFTGGPGSLAINGTSIAMGTANLFIPGADASYAAPSLVLHYIDAHQYCPPAPFLAAVRACPAMKSMGYLRALMRHGVTKLGKADA